MSYGSEMTGRHEFWLYLIGGLLLTIVILGLIGAGIQCDRHGEDRKAKIIEACAQRPEICSDLRLATDGH